MSETPYGLSMLWAEGDWIIRSVAVLLLVMSVLSWYVMLTKGLRLAQLRRMAREAANRFWHAKGFEEGLELLKPNRDENPFRALAEEGAEAVTHHAQNRTDLHGSLNVSDWIISCLRRSIDDTTAEMQSGLVILASVGSTAPFVGLFGTVWGIYHALISISLAGQASIDKVAGPVGEALIMTALGLAVAIPAVLGYNAIVRGNKAVLARLHRFAHDLHAYFVTGARLGGQGTVTALRPTVRSTH
jgi:biopolymer transport protein ExbB